MTPQLRDRSLLRTLCLVLAVAPCAASAQSTAPSPVQAGTSYRELIRKAVQEYELGNWAEAKLFFTDAHALNPNARTMRGLGLVAYALRNYVEAQTWFQQALDSHVEPLPDKLRIEVSEYLRLSEHFLAHLRVAVDPGEAEIRLDDKPLDSSAMAGGGGATVNPGPHELIISQNGYETVRRHLDLDAAANIELSFRLHSLLPVAPPPPQPLAAAIQPEEPKPLAPQPDAPFIGGWLVAGGSAAMAIVGGVLIGLGVSDVRKVEHAKKYTEWSSVESAKNRAPVLSGVGFALLGVGVAGIAAGVVWQVVEDDAHPDKLALQVTPNGLRILGKF
jgi:hypothetical protein